MSVCPVLLKDIRRTAIANHQAATGYGNYNRFAPLSPRNRLPSAGKRLRELSLPELAPAKTPRLDPNAIFDQLKVQDPIFQEAKNLLDTVTKTVEECCSAEDGALGTTIFAITKILSLLLKSQENLTSTLIDSCQVNQEQARAPPTVPLMDTNTGTTGKKTVQSRAPPAPPITAEEAAKRKVKQVLREAEKKTIIFNLDLGTAPTMNKEAIARKVTMALNAKAQSGDHDYHIGDAEEVIDDILSCSKLEFLGSTTRKFFNKRDNNDIRNNKMCTLPVRMDFKDRDTRIQAEISMRKICKVSCSTPYPRRLRAMLDSMVKEGKEKADKCFIRTRVNIDKLCVEAHARKEGGWEDLKILKPIPLDILDRYTPGGNQPHEGMDEDEVEDLS